MHCKQCDTPTCDRWDECQTLDIMHIPSGVDFVIGSINGHVGGTPYANVGGVEIYGDSPQDAINKAVAEYNRLCAEEDAAKSSSE